MNRILAGVLIGVVVAAATVVVLLATGWLALGAPPDPESAMTQGDPGVMQAPAAGSGEHAGHQMPEVEGMGEPGSEALDAGEGRQMSGSAEQDAGEHAAAEHEATAAPTGDTGSMPPDAVMISPERQQLIGIRTARVERADLDRTIRTVGRVEYDERRVAHIHTKVNGWIENLEVDFTGKLVEEGQPLLDIYSPELLSTQEEYLLALRAVRTLGESSVAEVGQSARSLLRATRRRLQLWDVTDEQIDRLEETGEPSQNLTLYSPIRGFVIHKGAYEGKFVGPKDELYTIADLGDVWIIADVYEYELPLVREGQPARVTFPYFPGETFRGRVDYVYPYLEGETRTARLRMVFSNPGWRLKPDMYANVELTARVGEGLLIPEDAIIDTGTRQVAFRVLPGGHFQPVEVQTGVKVGDRFQVLAGLSEGEEVVSGAAFLVDSESKLRSALRGMGGHQH